MVIASFTSTPLNLDGEFPLFSEFMENRPETVDTMIKNMYFADVFESSEITVPRDLRYQDYRDNGDQNPDSGDQNREIRDLLYGMYMELIIFDLISPLRGLKPKLSRYFDRNDSMKEIISKLTGRCTVVL